MSELAAHQEAPAALAGGTPASQGEAQPGAAFRSLGVSHLEQYFGVWAIKEDVFRAAVDRVSRMDLVAHVAVSRRDGIAGPASYFAASAAGGSATYTRNGYWLTRDGIAVVELTGPLMKYDSSLSDGTSTVRARQAIRAASRDNEVKSIALVIDSPGGTVAGTRDLAEEVGGAAASKPVIAYGEDMVASAAYWVASQATRIYVNSSALVGSIGTFAVLEDFSARATMMGIEVHVIRAGEFKGTGVAGTPITGKIIDDAQRIVDALNAQFLAAVASGRTLASSRVQELADGRVHVGEAAVALGLADGVRTFDEVLSELRGETPTARAKDGKMAAGSDVLDGSDGSLGVSTKEGESMSGANAQAPAAPGPATLAELKEHLVGASAEFLVAQLEAGATLVSAQKAWATAQAEKVAALEKEASAPSVSKPGSSAVAESSQATADESGDPVEQFESRIGELVGKGMDRFRAIGVVVARDPELHKAYLLAKNPGPKLQRMIKEKYE